MRLFNWKVLIYEQFCCYLLFKDSAKSISLRELSYRMEQRGTEGISKFTVKLSSRMQESEDIYIAKNDLMTQGLQNELCGSETSSRKAFALYS